MLNKYIIIIVKEVKKLVKRREVIKILTKNGFVLARNGSNHDIYVRANSAEAVPRHREIDNKLFKAICKRNNIKV